jgi:hypothetical protein
MSDTTRPPSPTPPASPDGEGLAQRLIDQVNALQQRIDKAERRIRIERALADAQAADVQAAADEIEHDATQAAESDLAGVVRRLKRTKPGLFKSPTEVGGATNLPAQQPRPEHHLTVLREKARQGDRASLLLYLRARRDKA